MKRFPMAHKVDTSHPYTSHDATDIRKTFARVKKQQAAAPTPVVVTAPNVKPIRKAKP